MSTKPISKIVDEISAEQVKVKTNVFNYPRTLYPAIEPYKTHRLKVDDIHELYIEESGNPQSEKCVIFCHGGPGGGLEDNYRRYFDPVAYRVVLFDQRGCGKSTPFACLENNTTWHLVDDMEKIRVYLGINNWIVFGGSWGSTLALSYAETHPSRVKALCLRGIFTLRREELLFFYQCGGGANWIFPDYFAEYVKPIPVNERYDMISAYNRRLTGTDEKIKLEAALAWTAWEMATSKLIIDKEKISGGEDPQFAIPFARIENHYFVHGGWFNEDDQLIKNAHILKNIPGVIVGGRYDIVCPAKSAWDLKQVWGDKVDLTFIPDSGHSMSEPGIISCLVEAMDRFRDL